MKKALKITGIVLVVIIAIIISIPFLFKSQLLEITKEEINKNINAKVEFADFNVSIFHSFPSLTISLEELAVTGVDKFEGDTLLAMKQLYTDLDIMSVISGDEIKITSILLENPRINGKILADSSANWDIVKETGATPEDTTTSTDTTQFKMALKSFKIVDAYITYSDIPGATFATINDFDFDLSGDFTADQTKLAIQTSIAQLTAKYEGVTYLSKAEMNFKAEIDADLAKSRYVFTENLFRINALELGFDGFLEMPDDNMAMDIKFNTNKTDFKSLLSMVPGVFLEGFEGIETEGNLKLEGMAKGILNTDKEIYPSFNLALVVENAKFKYPDLPKAVTDININLAISNPDGVLDHTFIDLSKFHVAFAENPFDVSLTVKTPISDPAIKCNFAGKIDLDNMKDFIPLDSTEIHGLISTNISLEGTMSQLEQEKYEEFKALGNLLIENFKYSGPDFEQGVTISKTELEFTPQYVFLKSFDSKIGKSDLQMNGRLENFIPYVFSNGTVKGALNISSTMFDANEFMSTDTTAEVEDTSTTPMEVVEVPGNIEFNLNSVFKEVKYDNMSITNIQGNIAVKDKKVDMSNLSMNLLGGSLIMNGYYSTADIKKPVADFGLNVSDFDITQTFTTFNSIKSIAPFLEKCKGSFSTNLSVNMIMGGDMMPVLNTVNGKGGFSSKDIKITGAETINKIAEKLHYDALKDLSLKNVSANFTITNGNIVIAPFEVKVDDMKAVIGGTNNLDQTIDYKIAMSVPRSKFGGAANQVVDGLLSQAAAFGVSSPIGDIINVDALITGTNTDPKISIKLSDKQNSGSSVKDQLKNELAKQKAELEAKAKAELAAKKKELETKAKAELDAKKKEAEAKAKAEADKQKKKLENEAKNKLKGFGK